MASTSESFAAFVGSAPVAGALQTTDKIAVLQGGATKSIPAVDVGMAPVATVSSGSSYNAPDTNAFVAVNKATGSATAVLLPATSTIGRFIQVADCKGDASTNQITVSAVNALTIDGQSSDIIAFNYQVTGYKFIGTGWKRV